MSMIRDEREENKSSINIRRPACLTSLHCLCYPKKKRVDPFRVPLAFRFIGIKQLGVLNAFQRDGWLSDQFPSLLATSGVVLTAFYNSNTHEEEFSSSFF